MPGLGHDRAELVQAFDEDALDSLDFVQRLVKHALIYTFEQVYQARREPLNEQEIRKVSRAGLSHNT